VRILITGGNGFLGRRVAALALARGQQVRLLGRTRRGRRAAGDGCSRSSATAATTCCGSIPPLVPGPPFQVIVAVEGRRDDLCSLLNPDDTPRPCFPGTIRRAILFADAPIADYRATREQPGQLHVALALPPDTPFAPVTAAICASTISTVTGYGCQPPDLTITEGLASPKKREPGDGAGDGAAERGTGRRPACHLARRRGR